MKRTTMPEGNGYDPCPPPVPHGEPAAPRTKGPLRTPRYPAEGRPQVTKRTLHAPRED